MVLCGLMTPNWGQLGHSQFCLINSGISSSTQGAGWALGGVRSEAKGNVKRKHASDAQCPMATWKCGLYGNSTQCNSRGSQRRNIRYDDTKRHCSPQDAAFSAGVHQHQQQQQEISMPAAREFMASTDVGGSDGGGAPPKDGNDRWEGSGNDPSPSGGAGFYPLALLIRGVRGRLEADPYFANKLMIECGLDAAIITGVNIMARKERFLKELEFTFCQLAISLLSDFAIVYLLAPSTTRPPPVTGSLRARLKLNTLPAHVFQFSPAGARPFTVQARLGTLILKGIQYGGVGLVMGALGAACVHGLIRMRESVDPTFVPPKRVQSILGTGAVWSGFMATSSTIRYNILTIAEDILYMKGPRIGQMGSFAFRLLNNWTGAAQWVAVTKIHKIDEEWKPANQE